MSRIMLQAGLLTLAMLALGSDTHAGRLDDAVKRTGDGEVRFEYPVREGVHSRGGSWEVEDGVWIHRNGSECPRGPMVARLRVRRGEVTRLRLDTDCRRGLASEPAIDLGAVTPGEAAAFLLDLARGENVDVAEDAVFGASVAEGVEVWPDLLKLARDRHRPEDVREAALFWLGQAAAREVTRELTRLVEDDSEELEIRQAALFALSQRPEAEGFPALTRVARESPHPQIRETAMFWLAQLEDPRVVDFFESILLER